MLEKNHGELHLKLVFIVKVKLRLAKSRCSEFLANLNLTICGNGMGIYSLPPNKSWIRTVLGKLKYKLKRLEKRKKDKINTDKGNERSYRGVKLDSYRKVVCVCMCLQAFKVMSLVFCFHFYMPWLVHSWYRSYYSVDCW